MRKILLALAVLLGAATSPVVAHEGGLHVKGTVTSVSAEQITVKGADGHESKVAVTNTTVFVRGNVPAKAADVKEGERVVIHSRRTNGALEATEVRLKARPARQKR